MLFNSLEFLIFLPVSLAVHAVLPKRFKWLWLLVASYGFYASFGMSNLIYLGAITGVVYLCGYGMTRADSPLVSKWVFVLGLVTVLGSLVGFKFYDFLAGELENISAIALPRLGITAPVGYSFYAFMAASYLIDLRRGDIRVENNLGRLAHYIAWFPKILAGPIERATTFIPQILDNVHADPTRWVAGLQLILWGLFKKVVIADNLAPIVDNAFGIAAYAAPMELLIACYFFAFQIYCDFSGYADIAIGVSLLFGLKLMENFRRPYLSASTAEFWSNRWHISLGRWFRDYLYIPLGGSQAGILRRYSNVMLVFIISGLWHAGLGYGVGWSFLVWGALNGAYQWVGLATRPAWRAVGTFLPLISTNAILRVLRIILTFHLILLSWVFFRAETIDQALLVLSKIWNALPSLPGLVGRYPFTSDHAFGLTFIVLLVAIEVLDERRSIWKRLAAMPVALRWAFYYMGFFALIFLGRWQAQEFIYMQF